MMSIEGNRGMPRMRPPFPATSGLWRRPTNINNVETLSGVPWIILNGAEAFASRGYEKSKGTKVFALAGKINRTGLAEVPMGLTLREVIFGIGGGIKNGKTFKAVQMGGPSGGLSARVAARPARRLRDHQPDRRHRGLGRDGGHRRGQLHRRHGPLLPAVHAVGELRQVRALPDRHQAHARDPRAHLRGQGRPEDLEFLEDVAEQVKIGSLCALGGTAPNPVLTALKYFREEFEEHVFEHKCRAGVCKALTTYTRSSPTRAPVAAPACGCARWRPSPGRRKKST